MLTTAASPIRRLPADRREAFAAIASALVPGLSGQRGLPAVAVPPALLAAASWTGTGLQPVTGVPVSRLPAPPTGFRRTLVDLLPEIPVTGGGLSVPQLTTPGDPAPPHVAGEDKVEAGLVFDGETVRLAGTATVIRITDELLDDVAGLGAWLDRYLGFMVKLGEEDRLLNGPGGFMTHPLIPASAATGDDLLDKLTAAAGEVAAASGLEADTYVVNPVDWTTMLASESARLDATAGLINGVAVIRTAAMAAGAALVGAAQVAAVIGRQGETVVEGTRSHLNDFIENKAALRASSRIALGVLMPTAFVTIA